MSTDREPMSRNDTGPEVDAHGIVARVRRLSDCFMTWLRAGVVLGIGLGGFVDGIVLHQIAQWHNMGSAILPPTTMDAMSRNMHWDGFFHAATWVITLVGVYMLRRTRIRGKDHSGLAFTGEMIFGWGAF